MQPILKPRLTAGEGVYQQGGHCQGGLRKVLRTCNVLSPVHPLCRRFHAHRLGCCLSFTREVAAPHQSTVLLTLSRLQKHPGWRCLRRAARNAVIVNSNLTQAHHLWSREARGVRGRRGAGQHCNSATAACKKKEAYGAQSLLLYSIVHPHKLLEQQNMLQTKASWENWPKQHPNHDHCRITHCARIPVVFQVTARID